jgi:hypothetical protein
MIRHRRKDAGVHDTVVLQVLFPQRETGLTASVSVRLRFDPGCRHEGRGSSDRVKVHLL